MKVDIEQVVEFDVENLSKSDLEAHLDRQIDFYNKLKSRSQNIFTIIIAILALLATAISGDLPEVLESIVRVYNITAENNISAEMAVEIQLIAFFVVTGILFVMDSIIWLSEVLFIRNPEMLLGSAREVDSEYDFSFNSFSSISPLENEKQRYQESVRLNNYLLQYMSDRLKYGYASLSSALQLFMLSITTYWMFSINVKIIRYLYVFAILSVMTLGLGSLLVSLFIDWNRELEVLDHDINLNILTFAPGFGKRSKRQSTHTVIYIISLLSCILVYPFIIIYLYTAL